MTTRFFFLFFLLTTGLLSAQNSLLRMPRISPDAQEMAFSYQGDIWIYNFNTQQTKRITIHEGYESNPVWNTSGDQLAFSSNRKGKNNIFTIGFLGNNGGKAKKNCDIKLIVNSNNTARIQECHIFLGHFILEKVEDLIISKK